MNPHLNVFHSYGTNKFHEDNITRALVLTLRSSPELGRRFLQQLVDREIAIDQADQIQSNLREGPGNPKGYKKAYVLPICRDPEHVIDGDASTKPDTPDAWLRIPGKLIVAIEAKTQEPLNNWQLEAYRVQLGTGAQILRPPRTWTAISRFFENPITAGVLEHDSIARFLVVQFLEFVRWAKLRTDGPQGLPSEVLRVIDRVHAGVQSTFSEWGLSEGIVRRPHRGSDARALRYNGDFYEFYVKITPGVEIALFSAVQGLRGYGEWYLFLAGTGDQGPLESAIVHRLEEAGWREWWKDRYLFLKTGLGTAENMSEDEVVSQLTKKLREQCMWVYSRPERVNKNETPTVTV